MGDQGKERPIVEFRHITKQFSGVKVLEDVSFFINRGEVHCILGENGAGKSTLMKILTGVYHAEEGEILINGERVNVCDIREARKLNIGTVFQENSLVPHMTVAENIFLTREIKNRSGLVDWKKMRSETIRWGQELGVELDPDIRVKKLTVAGQQLVEIVKVFSQNPQIVILDEPTSSLSDKEIDNLFSIIRRMQKKGVTFIYISHRMEEIKQIGNSGTVLRDGKFVVRIEDVRAMEIENIISYIVGRPLDEQFPKRKAVIGDVLLEAKNITVPGLVQDVSFQVKRGEVLGFSGLVGAGRSETAKAVFGVSGGPAVRY
ncbi:sugar ABC transporter ATP-binding protein [Clostridium sp. AM58-1XD]|uniref:sugar ABC transporter ATP-binding protein n=1 Tax=Clostridium sp. AM58-1XD TaxID=2292307 RepID=UPI000E4A5B9C|nr:sugar ABC transporter ATP-binding protein [Clostridium sp. AM58-1XD]RGY98585.1 sugar ABC transporter ATP-binding protein [Clostridium sp. AM58-1XD]